MYILHNAARVGRNPMLRADSLHAYVFTIAYIQAQATPTTPPSHPPPSTSVTRREKIKIKFAFVFIYCLIRMLLLISKLRVRNQCFFSFLTFGLEMKYMNLLGAWPRAVVAIHPPQIWGSVWRSWNVAPMVGMYGVRWMPPIIRKFRGSVWRSRNVAP